MDKQTKLPEEARLLGKMMLVIMMMMMMTG